MDGIFERILQISLSGSVIVLAVLVLRLVLRNAPKRAVCLLWMIAVLRLLVPFQIESDWSLQPAVEPGIFAPAEEPEDYFSSGPVTETVSPEFLENAVTYPLQPLPEKEPEPVELLPWLWLAGVGILGVHGAVSYLRLKKRVRDAVIWEEGVWVCPGLDTAFVLGFFRPQIYLPVLTEEERELVLLHERQHIRRLDHWWKQAAYAAVSIHWFNPLAWVTYVLMCRDMELACDQETVKCMDNAKRKAYSAALLRCAVKKSGIAACPVAFGEISVKERIKMVLNYKKPGFWVTVVALIAAVAVGFFLLPEPAREDPVDALYAELEALKSAESIHLVIDMEIDSNYDGWDTCRQEFLRSDRIWYRNFDYQTSAGALTTSYLYYDAKVYAREISEDAALADRPWAQIEDLGFGELSILTRDWTGLEVLDIEKKLDGSTVITIQADLTPTEDTTYYEKTYEFHLDADGKLTSMVTNCHASKYIREWGAQGTFEIRSKDTVHFLDTPAEEIRERIMECWGECKEHFSTAGIYTQGIEETSHHAEGAGHHHHGW